jgi:cytoskeleton protein RodZ
MAMAAQKTNASDSGVPIGDETPGSKLRIARERAGLTREAIAKQLNLLASQVAALEEDRFERFPAETFVKGHLRSYARLLKIDVDEILHAYYLLKPPTPTARKKINVQCRPQTLGTPSNRWRSYTGIAAVFVVLCALWAWQQRRDQSQLLSLNAGSSSVLPGGIESALTGGAEATLLDSVQMLPVVPAPATAGVAPATTDTVAGPAAIPAAAPPSANTAPLAATDSDRLSLHFSADCWIEVKDRDDKVLVATLKHADDKLQIEGRGPFKVLLGYAPGVEMAYNGAPVKVDAPPVGNRSTRLIVGNS